MKKLLLLPFLCLSLHAAGPTTNNVTFYFHWFGPQDYAGLTTNDFFSQVTFRVYSSTNVSLPMNQWPLYATWAGLPFLNQGPVGTQWTNQIAVTFTSARFFAFTVFHPKAAGGESPFSNLDYLLAPLPPGMLDQLK